MSGMARMGDDPLSASPWAIPSGGAQDPPPALTVDEQIRAVALTAVAATFTGKPPGAEILIRHASVCADWIRTGMEDPVRTVQR